MGYTPSRTDVIFSFATETLADAVDRGFSRPPDRLLLTLAADHAVKGLLIVDPTRWFPNQLLRRSHKPELLSRANHVRPWRLRHKEAVAVDAIRSEVLRRDRYLKNASKRSGMHRPAVVSFDPFLAAFAPFDWARSVTFYARDDWASFPPRRDWWPAYEVAYDTMASSSRGVLAVSGALLDRIKPAGPSAIIPNGIEPLEWLKPSTPPSWLDDFPRPIALYIGTIDDRVDPAAVAAATDAGATVLLVGPITARADKRLLSVPGVYRVVAANRLELVAIVAAADVGLIPHRLTDLTSAMSPLKLFEYRAAGLPVASVQLPPVAVEARVDTAIVLASSNDRAGFAAAVRTAISRGVDDMETRVRTITRTSWSERHREALRVILR